MNINEKEDFVKKLKEKFDFPDEDLLYEDIYEWNIENWKELSNENKSDIFKLCGLNWNIILYPSGFKTKKEFVSLFLENFNALRYYNFDDDYKYNNDNQFNINVDTKFAFYIREYDNISNYEAKETSFKFDNYNYYHGIQEFIDIKKFNEKLLKNNTKLVVGIYLCRYENNDEEEFINKIKSYINNKNEIYILHQDYREFEIKFEDLSKLNNNSEILFETFEDYNYNWNFSLKKEIINNESYISFKLLNKSNNDEVIKTNLVFFIRNNKDYSYFKTTETDNFVYFGNNSLNNNNSLINYREDFTMDKFIKIDNLIKTYENYDSVIAGVYICIYNNNGLPKENYLNIIRNNIINDNGITIHAENYFESNFNNNGIYSDIDFKIGNYIWNLNVTLNEDNSYDLVLTYISKNNQNTNCGDPYINYIFILRKLDDYTVYKIKNSSEIIKLSKENNKIIEKSFINYKNDDKLKVNDLMVGVYIRIYQTDNNNNIKAYTAEKAMEIFENKLKEKNIIFYPKEKWTIILKTNSGSGIFIHINQNTYMISGYWHPLRRHEGIIGQKINGIKTDVKNEISDAGYWAIAINTADNQYGCTYYRTLKDYIVNNNEINSLDNYICEPEDSNEKYLFMNEIKNRFYFQSNELLQEDIFEWNIENWNGLIPEKKSELFNLCGLNWNLILFPNKGKKYISLFLENFDALKYYNSDDKYEYNDDNQFNINVYVKYVLYVRHCNDLSKYEAKETSFKYDNINYYHGIQELAEIKKINEQLLEDNKLVVGVYICRYKNTNEDEFRKQIKSYIDNKNEKMILQQYYKEFNVSLHDILKYNNDYIIKDEDFNDNQNNWNLSIQKKSINDKYFISFKISNLKNIGKAIKTNLVFYIRNDTDYSYFKAKGTNNFIYFGETNNNDNYLSIKFIDNFTMDKFLTIEELSKLFSNCNSIIAGVYICIYNNNDLAKDNYINIMRNNIKNDYGITLHAENYFESSFNNNGIYSNIDFNLGNYSWHFDVTLKEDKSYYLTLKYTGKNDQNSNYGDPYINYVVVLRKSENYEIYKIENSTDLIKIDKENNTIIINSFINSNYNSKLEISNLIIGIYLRIYQTDNNDNIKTYTAQKAMEIFKSKIICNTDFIYNPNDKWTYTAKTNSGSGIFISIFDDKNMLSAYWHPLRKHCGIVGEIVKSVKNYIKIVESEPGYWAIAIHHRIENGHTFYNTIKE